MCSLIKVSPSSSPIFEWTEIYYYIIKINFNSINSVFISYYLRVFLANMYCFIRLKLYLGGKETETLLSRLV